MSSKSLGGSKLSGLLSLGVSAAGSALSDSETEGREEREGRGQGRGVREGTVGTPGSGDLRHVTDSHSVSRPEMFSGGPGVPPLYDESPERVLELLRSRDSIR